MKTLDEKNEWKTATKSLDQDMENFRWLFRLRDRIDEFHEMVLEVLHWEVLIETAVSDNRLQEGDRKRLNHAIRSLNVCIEKIQQDGQSPAVRAFADELGLARNQTTFFRETLRGLRRSRRIAQNS